MATKHGLSRQTSTIINVAFIMLFQVCAANATDTLKLDDLGEFRISWSTAEPTKYFKGQPRLGSVNHIAGANYVLTLPFAIQQINYQKANGALVEKDESIAVIGGMEVEHFIDMAESAEAIFTTAKQHYEASQISLRERTIQNPEWLAIAKNYHQAKLDFNHHQHFLSFLHYDESHEVKLVAPIAGYLQVNPNYLGDVQQPVLEILPVSSLYVKVSFPSEQIDVLSHFETTDSACLLTPVIQEQMANQFQQTVWNALDNKECEFLPGQSLSITPYFHFDGYKVKQSAVFRLNDDFYIGTRRGNHLAIHQVEIRGSVDDSHFITSSAKLEGLEVIVTSVSAMQGVLLGLGGE